jgi:hypothetical protein
MPLEQRLASAVTSNCAGLLDDADPSAALGLLGVTMADEGRRGAAQVIRIMELVFRWRIRRLPSRLGRVRRLTRASTSCPRRSARPGKSALN